MAGLAIHHAEVGNDTAAEAFDLCAQLVDIVESELRFGVAGPVSVQVVDA